MWSSLIKTYTLPYALENSNFLNEKLERERGRAFTHASNEDCAFICFQNIEEEFPVLGFVQDNQELLSTQQEIKALTKH